MVLEELDHQLPGDGLIIIADADGPEEDAISRELADVSPDAFPEKHQRGIAFLVFGADKRAPQLQGRPKSSEQVGAKVKQGSGVKTFDAHLGKNLVASAEPIGPDQFPRGGVPDEKMFVPLVEPVQVEWLAGSFTGGSVGDFAQPADFLEKVRYLAGSRAVDAEPVAVDQKLLAWQCIDFGGESFRSAGHGNWNGLRGTGNLRWGCRFLGAVPEHERALAQVVGDLLLAADSREPFPGDGGSDAGNQPAATLVEQLAWEQRGAKARMHEAQRLEERTISAIEKNWQDRRLGAKNDPGYAAVPTWLQHLSATHVQVGNFAGGKDRQRSPLLYPADCLPN